MIERKRISAGGAIPAQVMLLFFFLPFNAIVLYFTIGSRITTDSVLFFLCCLIPSSFIIYKAFTTSDIYIAGEEIIIEKLFYRKKRLAKDVKKVGSGLLPLTYYLKFDDNEKVVFVRDINSTIKGFFTDDSKYLKEVKNKIMKARITT